MAEISVYPAHIRFDENGNEHIQTVAEHNIAVADICKAKLAESGLSQTGYLMGILHDMGKYTPEFASYITKAAHGEKVARGSVVHTFAPVKLLWELYGNDETLTARRVTVEILSFVIGSHHGQFDCVSPDGSSGFEHRINGEIASYEHSKECFSKYCLSRPELDKLFDDAVTEITKKINLIAEKESTEFWFSCAVFCRMLLSVLIDADRIDTAEFMQNKKLLTRFEDMSPIWGSRLSFVENKLAEFPCDTDIRKARAEFSRLCGEFDYADSGIYRLFLPTGGGKTLSSLRAALTVAKKYGKKRIIFLTPLLSVLDQNAKIIHDYINDDTLITEHHSNVIKEENSTDPSDTNELTVTSWDLPIIITTMVQFLNTLFDGRTTCIRRMQSLKNSVIVFDEVQSLPNKLISCFNLTLRYLTKNEGCLVILCSATQPCFDKTEHPMVRPTDIIKYSEALWKPFERVEYHFPTSEYLSLEDVSVMACEKLEKHGSVLVICNTKAEALNLYKLIHDKGVNVFHLSTSMCMAHRRGHIKKIIDGLEENKPIICVSTQLVEAGIDFSFGCVIRFHAGLDNVIQAAGRCNRNGEHGEKCPVYVVRIKNERLSRLPDITAAQKALSNTLAMGNFDISSGELAEVYYKNLFRAMPKGAQDYYCPSLSTSMLKMLSRNDDFCGKSKNQTGFVCQAFKTAGECFEVFEDMTFGVVVPFGDSNALLTELGSESSKWDIEHRKSIIKKLSAYTVSLFGYQLDDLKRLGAVKENEYDKNILILEKGYYTDEYGIDENGENKMDFLEV